jgi:Holliday junction resolvase-like predicted endonuclease
MLTENDVVEKLVTYLKYNGYIIVKSLNTYEKGIDIIAKNKTEILHIEAKGETSSKQGTKRYGKEFSLSQVKTHISRAILASMEEISKKDKNVKIKVAIAIPNNETHKKVLDKVIPAIKALKIRIYLVGKSSIQEI